MQFALLIQALEYRLVQGDLTQDIRSIHYDSRQIQAGDVFVAIRGTQADGHQFIDRAIAQGAVVIVAEEAPTMLHEGITYLTVANTAKALGHLAAAYHGNPSRDMKVVAITGTNGKTTTATLLFKLFRGLGYNVGLLSTVQNQINDRVYPARLTTPDPLETQSLMAEMLHQGCTHVFMEASSHAIVQERIAGIHLTGAMFSNITHDHLDFHGTFENYIKAKKKLFDDLPRTAFALTNIDDKRGLVMLQNCPSTTQRSFALRSPADFKGKIIENTLHGLHLDINGQPAWYRLIGDFNAYNLVGVYGAAILLGEDSVRAMEVLSGIGGAAGRFEQMRSAAGITGIVDYAHTPDALKNVLETMEQFRQGSERIITVVGCGGDRDRSKRPVMAQIAAEFSDVVILTSDNPRSEDPMEILQEMLAGLSQERKHKTLVIENRREAIARAATLAQAGDMILVAGKGHETYQEIKGIRHPFDDRQVLAEAMNIREGI